MGGDWINFLSLDLFGAVWTLQNVSQFFVLIEIFENSTIFTMSILLFIALKRWNFPDNLDIKGKIAATFLIRSHSLSIQNNMAKKKKKKKIKYGANQKKSPPLQIQNNMEKKKKKKLSTGPFKK